MESWPKTKNGYSTSSAVVDELEVSPPTKCPRYSGDDTTMYLRKKNWERFYSQGGRIAFEKRIVSGLKTKRCLSSRTICINATLVSIVRSTDDVDK